MTSKLVSREVEEKRDEIEYPCLMRSETSDNIVLMSGECEGTIVVSSEDNPWNIGDYSTGWDMIAFTPLDPADKIVLSNGDV